MEVNLTTQDLINELQRDDQNREINFKVISSKAKGSGSDRWEIDRVDIVPNVIITLVEK